MKKFASILLALALVCSCVFAVAEEPAEPKYELIYIDTFDTYADNAEWNMAWGAANVGPEGLGSAAELVEIEGYAQEGKSVKWTINPEKADWWSSKLVKKGGFAIQGDGISFWMKNDAPMWMVIEFFNDDWTYQCNWEIPVEEMQPGEHQYFLKWEDLVIKEAGVELAPGEIDFKEWITAFGEFMFYGFGPEGRYQGGWEGECYIDSVAFFTEVK